MKKFPFVLLVCLVSLSLRAQRVELGFNAGPALSYRYLQSNPKTFKELLDASERPILGYRVGLDIVLWPQATWQVGTGLLYNLRGFSNHMTLTDDNGRSSDSRIAMHIHYLEVPVFLRYRFGIRDKQNFYALAGINNSFFLTNTIVVKEGPFSDEHNSRKRRAFLCGNGTNCGVPEIQRGSNDWPRPASPVYR